MKVTKPLSQVHAIELNPTQLSFNDWLVELSTERIANILSFTDHLIFNCRVEHLFSTFYFANIQYCLKSGITYHIRDQSV